MASLVPCYTAEEIRRFPDHRLRYEVIRGELFVTPAPGTRHQRTVVELLRLLQDYLDTHSLGEALVAPFEVQFAEDTAVQPDVIVFLTARAHQLTAERFLGSASLVVEVVSYSSKRTDRMQKRDLYVEGSVDEYWIVDPELRQVERWRLAVGEPDVLTAGLRWQPDRALAALEIDLPALFLKVWR